MAVIQLLTGDCLALLPTLAANSVDSIVTDPPYGLGFMGKDWDHGVPGVPFWEAALRVAKPGAYLLAFGGTRTFHRLAVAIEDAGWEIRDTVMWVYGSGFPKSLDVSKAIDAHIQYGGSNTRRLKQANDTRPGEGRERGRCKNNGIMGEVKESRSPIKDTPVTPDAERWQGWGTALKPAWEPIIVARKPLDGTVAGNVLRWGTGGINVDGCRIPTNATVDDPRLGGRGEWHISRVPDGHTVSFPPGTMGSSSIGRWPANVIHDGSDEVLAGFPMTASGLMRAGEKDSLGTGMFGGGKANSDTYGDTGSAARFFYCAKASKADRDEGCEGLPLERPHPSGNGFGETTMWNGENGDEAWKTKNPNLPRHNHHPTVKPTALMRYLVRLVTPPGGTVLDPFCGSGSTGKAARLEGFDFTGMDLSAEYIAIAERRIAAAQQQPQLEASCVA